MVWTKMPSRSWSCSWHNAAEQGFKRMDAFEAIENALPAREDRASKLRITGRVLVGLAEKGLLRRDEKGKRWFVTEAGTKILHLEE